ncbi:hypothetical protein B0H15DRAFT_540150 [Mycena belliarum]|uniref:Uncharacterized protein n=1 Tax=Mycena belliarum TaxID=1033014 RepID=A0AAD6TUE2_9AGAR|nr:hypothetical protein B0H15DRAFT_540150 [Mycena belliae]
MDLSTISRKVVHLCIAISCLARRVAPASTEHTDQDTVHTNLMLNSGQSSPAFRGESSHYAQLHMLSAINGVLPSTFALRSYDQAIGAQSPSQIIVVCSRCSIEFGL